MPGIAQSITTTCGLSDAASCMASSPSLASPTTAIVGIVFQHPAEAAPHQRVIVGKKNGDLIRSCASFALRSELVNRTSVPPPAGSRNSSVPPSISARSRIATIPRPRRSRRRRSDALCRDPPRRARSCHPSSAVAPSLVDPGMPGDVVQRLLHHPIDMNADVASSGNRRCRPVRSDT